MKSDVFRSALHRQLAQADERGVLHLDVNSDRLHKQIGDYRLAGHRMPVCCQVMYTEGGKTTGSRTPPKGKGAVLTIRYLLPWNPARSKLRPGGAVTMPNRIDEWLQRQTPGD